SPQSHPKNASVCTRQRSWSPGSSVQRESTVRRKARPCDTSTGLGRGLAHVEPRCVPPASVGGNGTAGIVCRLVGLDQTGLGLGDRLTPFVGRDRELEQLAHGLEQSEGRQGQVVGIGGEAGVGKYQHTWN